MKKYRLKILFPFVGDTVGGSHVSAWQLILALRNLGHEPYIAVHSKGKHSKWIEDQGGKYHLVNLPYASTKKGPTANWSSILTGLPSAMNFMQKLNIDLVHCNDRRMNLSWVPWATVSGIPSVWHQHSVWPRKLGKQVKASLWLTNGIISASKSVAKDLPAVSKPHEIIYNPVAIKYRDKENCARRLRQELGFPEDTRLIGCFGNARALKRPETVAQAASILNNQYLNKIKVVWFGDDRDGVLAHVLNSEGQSCPLYRASFRSDVMSAIAGCDIVLSASEREAFGRTLVEAMALGVPVVASNAEGHCEILDNEYNGLLIPVGDAEACASAILRLLNEENLRRKLIKHGFETARQFDPMRHAREVLRFYEKLLPTATKKYSVPSSLQFFI